jgi:hypothetical protein
MIRYLKRIVIQNIVSPSGLAIISYCIFLFAWVFPSGMYIEYIHEPDLMFLDPLVLAFYTSCVAAFLLGVGASRFLVTGRRHAAVTIAARNPFLYLAIPVFLSLVWCSIYLKMLGGKLDFVALLLSQQGESIKVAGEFGALSVGIWSSGLFMLTAALWWSSVRAKQLPLRGIGRQTFRVLFFAGVILDVITCVATVDRTSLMPLIAGLSVTWLFGKTVSKNIKILRLLTIGLSSTAGVIAVFLLVSFLRGTIAIKGLMMLLLGYTIVSYNRMAALVLGVMYDSYQGRGVYLFPILRESEMLNKLFHLNERFDWPTAWGLWSAGFSSVASAGLNPGFNFYSVFGALYSDLGWLALAYLFVVGILVGYLWWKFRAGKTFAIVLYPWCAFCILFWAGYNVMFDGRVMELVKMAVALTVYDKLMLRQVHHAVEAEALGEVERSLPEPLTQGFAGDYFYLPETPSR